ncbi:MAG: Riboflavin biosynthesis protein RibD [bacterium ADurb.Bin429]|nr:MAG: Riboflavin biosynthesis protein RibD [bacterium ADurb.Bin429]
MLADDPALTARARGGRDPRRVIADPCLRTAAEAKIYAPAERPPLLVTAVEDDARLAPFRARGVEILHLSAPDGHFDLNALMATLGARDIVSLMVEAGGCFAGALLDARLVHKLRLYLAPLLIGGRDAIPALAALGAATLADAPRLRDAVWTRLGEDWRVEGYVGYA